MQWSLLLRSIDSTQELAQCQAKQDLLTWQQSRRWWLWWQSDDSVAPNAAIRFTQMDCHWLQHTSTDLYSHPLPQSSQLTSQPTLALFQCMPFYALLWIFNFKTLFSLQFVYLNSYFRIEFDLCYAYVKTVTGELCVYGRWETGGEDNEGPAQMDPESKVSSHEIWLKASATRLRLGVVWYRE